MADANQDDFNDSDEDAQLNALKGAIASAEPEQEEETEEIQTTPTQQARTRKDIEGVDTDGDYECEGVGKREQGVAQAYGLGWGLVCVS